MEKLGQSFLQQDKLMAKDFLDEEGEWYIEGY